MSKTLQALISETNTAIDRLKGNNSFVNAPIDYQAQALQTLYDNQVAPLMQQSAPDVTPEELAADRQAFIERHLMPSAEQQQVDAAYPTIDPMFREGMQTTQQLAQQQSNPFTDFARGLGSEVTEQASWGGLDALPAPQSTAGTAGQIAGGLFGGLVNTSAGAGLGLAAALGLAPFTGGASLAALPWFVGGGAALGAGTGAYSRDIRQQQDEGRSDFNYGRALTQGGGGVVGSLIPGMGAGITGKLLGVGADALVNAGTDAASQYVDRGKIDWRQVGTAGAFGAGGRVAGELGQLAGQAIVKGRNNRLEQVLAAQRELQRKRGAQQLRSGMVPVNIPQRATVQGRQGLAVRGYETMPTRVRPTTKDKLPSRQPKADVAGEYSQVMREKIAGIKQQAVEQLRQGNKNQATVLKNRIKGQMQRELRKGNAELAQEFAGALDDLDRQGKAIAEEAKQQRKQQREAVGLKRVRQAEAAPAKNAQVEQQTPAGGAKTEQGQPVREQNAQTAPTETRPSVKPTPPTPLEAKVKAKYEKKRAQLQKELAEAKATPANKRLRQVDDLNKLLKGSAMKHAADIRAIKQGPTITDDVEGGLTFKEKAEIKRRGGLLRPGVEVKLGDQTGTLEKLAFGKAHVILPDGSKQVVPVGDVQRMTPPDVRNDRFFKLAEEYGVKADDEIAARQKPVKAQPSELPASKAEDPPAPKPAGGNKKQPPEKQAPEQAPNEQPAQQAEPTAEELAQARREKAGITKGQTTEKGVVFNRENSGEALNAQTESAGIGPAQTAKALYHGVGKNIRNLDPENRAKFNKLDENTREILRTEFDTSTGLGRQRDPGDLQGAQPKKLTQVSPDAISRLPKDKQDWVNAVDYAMKGDQAITLDYAAEGGLSGKGGATKAQDATKRDAVTPLYWVETKNGDLTFFGTNSDGHMAQYYLDAPPARDAIDVGDGDIPRSQILSQPRPSTAQAYRGTYPNIYQGARTYELADVLNRGPRGEGIKTSYAKDILERAKLSGDILPEDLQQALKYDRSLDTVRAVRKYMAQNPATPKQVLDAFDRIATKAASKKKITAMEVEALRRSIEKSPTLETLQAGCKLFGLRID